jgi:CRISPR system Cascade subunit CasB
MPDLQQRIQDYVKKLRSFAREPKPDRASLAELRSGLGQPPGHAPRMHKHVVPHLDGDRPEDDQWFYAVGSLFALHPNDMPGGSLGRSFRALAVKDDSGSVEPRFLALLGADSADLPDHLRQAVSLLKAREVPVDYRALLNDLINWDNPDKTVQLGWARDYYSRQRGNPR